MTDTEREALCARIDELCVENERLRAEQAHWELGNCPNCPNVVSLQEALEQNAKLRELGGFMLRCISQYHDCADCLVNGEHCEISYIESDARELGIEVTA